MGDPGALALKTRPNLLQRLRDLRTREGVSLVLWLAFAVLLETFGPKLGPDTGLVAAIGCALLLARTTARWNRRSPLLWLASLRQFFARLVPGRAPWKLELGLDLRGTPPVPRGWPPILLWPLVGGSAALVALAPFAGHFPGALLGLAKVSFVLYAVAASALLVCLLGAGALFALLALFTLRERVQRRPPHAALVVAALVFALATPLATFFQGPQWLPLIGPLLALGMAALGLFARDDGDVALLWRRRGSASLRSLPALSFTGGQLALAALAALLLDVLASGARIAHTGGALGLGSGEPGLVVLPLVGFVFSWCAGFGLLALALVFARWLLARRAARLARVARVALYVRGVRGRDERRAVRRSLSLLGLDARFAPRPRRPHEVPAQFVDRPAETAWDPFLAEDVEQPLALELADLEGPHTAQRAARRDLRQDRLRLFAGLAQLLRAARRHDRALGNQRGEGFWLGPQHWFLLGLGRDRQADEEALREGLFEPRAGSAYADVLDWRARAHLLEVCRDVEVDLVFLQDGVSFGGLRRVLETLFEVHDIFGGTRRVEERDFVGLVGLRIVLHDFELGRRLLKTGYPEPDYDDLARARILHVFKDKGGGNERADTPLDLEDLPMPLVLR